MKAATLKPYAKDDFRSRYMLRSLYPQKILWYLHFAAIPAIECAVSGWRVDGPIYKIAPQTGILNRFSFTDLFLWILHQWAIRTSQKVDTRYLSNLTSSCFQFEILQGDLPSVDSPQDFPWMLIKLYREHQSVWSYSRSSVPICPERFWMPSTFGRWYKSSNHIE
jgi:hypothetical protein